MTEGLTVLVVDDEELDRTNMAQALRGNGYSVLEADRYGDAMAVFNLNRHLIRLLVADISLPDGNGCSLAIAIHKQEPNVRVLFVSGHVGTEICKYYGLDVTALQYLRKPFKQAELLTRIKEVLNSAEQFPKLVSSG